MRSIFLIISTIAIIVVTYNSFSQLKPSVNAVGVMDKTELPNITIVIEEFLDTRLQPLLPHLYFDRNSEKIPQRYNQINEFDTKSFEPKDLFSLKTLQVYYHVLNIIGKRMTEFDKATLTIMGSTDGKESGGINLAKKRAETIKDYFVNVWKISENRLIVKSSVLPSYKTKQSDAIEESDEENRRVEFESNLPQILSPIKLEQFSYKANPPKVRFYISSDPKENLQRWELNVNQAKQMLYEPAATVLPLYKDWSILDDPKKRPKIEDPVKYKLSVWDKNNIEFSTEEKYFNIEQVSVQKKIQKKLNDTLFDEYSLILFDFGEKKLNKDHENILNFIKNRITPDAIIRINGYTDHLGDRLVNKTISQKRAESVAAFLGHNNMQTKGYGEEITLMSNDLPEGRAYSRTVNIIAIIPTKH
jgi:outer membrane protein OmpA-like peptidoglycan-associated protein